MISVQPSLQNFFNPKIDILQILNALGKLVKTIRIRAWFISKTRSKVKNIKYFFSKAADFLQPLQRKKY